MEKRRGYEKKGKMKAKRKGEKENRQNGKEIFFKEQNKKQRYFCTLAPPPLLILKF